MINPNFAQKKSPGGKLIFSVLIFALAGGIAVAGYFSLSKKHGGAIPEKSSKEEVSAAEIEVKIIDSDAPTENAEKILDLLKGDGYKKSTISREGKVDSFQTLIFFKEEKFRISAQNIRESLIQKEKIYASLRVASLDEEKSADIVIMLGKSKEAPPN
jgi:hypothetical protein